MAAIDNSIGKANLEVFAETLEALAREDRNVVAVTSDSRGSGKLTPFGQQFPKQIIEVGIAEQNLVGVATGEYTVTGSQGDIFRHYGLSKEGITEIVLQLLKAPPQYLHQ